MDRPVVVGMDGSDASMTAARHAAYAAAGRGRPLRLVHGYLQSLGDGIPVTSYDLALPEPSEPVRRMLDEAATRLRTEWPQVDVEAVQIAGGPAAAVIDESRHAELVVVGSRGLGGFTGLLLGSVSAQVAAHARCPVLVVRPSDAPVPGDGPVVVGVESPASAPSVDFAADEAARRGVPLVLLHATRGADEPGDDPLTALAGQARRRHPEVLERSVSDRDPQHALVDASTDASVVVVGSRGRGGFTGLLLGSVSQTLIHHARCPVAVVHPVGHER